jgi:hypothetical protein
MPPMMPDWRPPTNEPHRPSTLTQPSRMSKPFDVLRPASLLRSRANVSAVPQKET